MYLSIDIGGTKTLLALFSSRGLCLKRLKFATEKDPCAFEEALSEHLKKFLPEKQRQHIKAITVAIPGIVKNESNSYSFKLGNLDWPKIDLITPIKNLFSAKIFFVNDADLATLYEASRPGRKSGKTVYLTFSTGIGGGIAENGKLSNSSSAFEPGHTKYTYKGTSKEWEDIAAAKAIIKDYKVSTIKDLTLTASTIEDLVSRLSLGLTDIIKRESPQTIIMGGPLAFIFEELKEPLLNSLNSPIKLQKARRPTESVIYGAFLYSKLNHKK